MFLSTDDQNFVVEQSFFCLLMIKLCSRAVIFLSTDDQNSAVEQSCFCLLMIKTLL